MCEMRDLPSVLPKYMKALLKSLAFIILYISIFCRTGRRYGDLLRHDHNPYDNYRSVYRLDFSIRRHTCDTTTAVLISILLTLPIYFIIPKIQKQNFFDVFKFKKTGISILGLSLILGTSLNRFISHAFSYLERLTPLENVMQEHQETIGRIMEGNFVIVFITVGIWLR